MQVPSLLCIKNIAFQQDSLIYCIQIHAVLRYCTYFAICSCSPALKTESNFWKCAAAWNGRVGVYNKVEGRSIQFDFLNLTFLPGKVIFLCVISSNVEDIFLYTSKRICAYGSSLQGF